ncbi:MAG: DUF3990 domain-containing protein [Oscillospiraceae bacterium]|nr:DUF3990 domain-containing protein [Oscillospiraceae bacterium]
MTESTLRLYHTGYAEIRSPDIRFGRKNADFGQGFYLSDSDEFAGKWMRERRDAVIHVNAYELNLAGLRVLRFTRDAGWMDYILRNRAGYADAHPEADVIIGPIANDTIYDTLGILTSGVLSREQSLELLRAGLCFEQTVIKTEQAAARLQWQSVRTLAPGEAAAFRERVQQEEAAYQALLARTLERITQE